MPSATIPLKALVKATNVFLRQGVMEGRMPFTPGDPFYGPSNMARLREGIEQEARHEVAASCAADGFLDLMESL